jgi:hypothetical protein
MFKTLYRCVRTAARHENGPAARSRLAYLENLAAGGATLHCLRANAGVLYRAAVCMNLDDIISRTSNYPHHYNGQWYRTNGRPALL